MWKPRKVGGGAGSRRFPGWVLLLRSGRKEMEKAGVFLEEPQEAGMVHAIPWLGACCHLSHSENDKSRRRGRLGNADTQASTVYPPVLVNICAQTQ